MVTSHLAFSLLRHPKRAFGSYCHPSCFHLHLDPRNRSRTFDIAWPWQQSDMFEFDWRGLLLPLAYLAVLGGTFMTFSYVYRKRKAGM